MLATQGERVGDDGCGLGRTVRHPVQSEVRYSAGIKPYRGRICRVANGQDHQRAASLEDPLQFRTALLHSVQKPVGAANHNRMPYIAYCVSVPLSDLDIGD